MRARERARVDYLERERATERLSLARVSLSLYRERGWGGGSARERGVPIEQENVGNL
jgi:hypothetical protein